MIVQFWAAMYSFSFSFLFYLFCKFTLIQFWIQIKMLLLLLLLESSVDHRPNEREFDLSFFDL